MNLTETSELLARVAAHDNRTVCPTDIETWHTALADITLADALAAVDARNRARRDWLVPADVVETVRRIRHDRLEHAQPPAVDPDNVPAWLAARRTPLRAIASSHQVTQPNTPKEVPTP